LWNFECLESFGAKEQGLLRSLGIFVDFWSVWSGLGLNHNYVLETKGPAATLTRAQGPQSNLQEDKGVSHKVY
jgi:hypothetical protein